MLTGTQLSDLQNELSMLWVIDGPAAVHARLLAEDETVRTALLMANIGARALSLRTASAQ
jgi:hypothetical protein